MKITYQGLTIGRTFGSFKQSKINFNESMDL